jgi:hypothetical protein
MESIMVEKVKKTRNRKSKAVKKMLLAIPVDLNDRLEYYLTNFDPKAYKTEIILSALENELNRRYAEFPSRSRSKATDGQRRQPMIKKTTKLDKGASVNTGRPETAGPLDTLAASHWPVNGPTLPEGGKTS